MAEIAEYLLSVPSVQYIGLGDKLLVSMISNIFAGMKVERIISYESQSEPLSHAIQWRLYQPLLCFTSFCLLDHRWQSYMKRFYFCCQRPRLLSTRNPYKQWTRDGSNGILINLFLRWFDACFALLAMSRSSKWTEGPKQRQNLTKDEANTRIEVDDWWQEESDGYLKVTRPEIYTSTHELSDRLALLVD